VEREGLMELRFDGSLVRVFRPVFDPGSLLLSWDRNICLTGNSVIRIHEPVTRRYNYKDKVAIPLDIEGKELVILFEELPENSREKVKRLFPSHPLLTTTR